MHRRTPTLAAVALVAGSLALWSSPAAGDPTAELTGTARDAGGGPLAGWSVAVGGVATTTAGDGTYALAAPLGDTSVTLGLVDPDAPDHEVAVTAPITVDADRELDLTLPTVALVVTVQDTDGRAIAATALAGTVSQGGATSDPQPVATGELFDGSGPAHGFQTSVPALTGTDGRATLRLLASTAPGRVVVAPPPAANLGGADLGGVAVTADAALPVTLATLRGVVRSSATTPLAGEALTFTPVHGGPARTATSGGTGTYAASLASDTHRVRLRRDSASSGRPASYDVSGSVDATTPATLDLTAPWINVFVTVRAQGGTAMSDVDVTVPCTPVQFSLAPSTAATGTVCGVGTTDSTGKATLRMLPMASGTAIVVPPASTGRRSKLIDLGAVTASKTFLAILPTGTGTAPTAAAGADATTTPGGAVTLDATGSSDPDPGPLTYAWSQVGGPSATVTDATTSAAHVTAPAEPAVLRFRVLVTDNHGLSGIDEVVIQVKTASK